MLNNAKRRASQAYEIASQFASAHPTFTFTAAKVVFDLMTMNTEAAIADIIAGTCVNGCAAGALTTGFDYAKGANKRKREDQDEEVQQPAQKRSKTATTTATIPAKNKVESKVATPEIQVEVEEAKESKATEIRSSLRLSK